MTAEEKKDPLESLGENIAKMKKLLADTPTWKMIHGPDGRCLSIKGLQGTEGIDLIEVDGVRFWPGGYVEDEK